MRESLIGYRIPIPDWIMEFYRKKPKVQNSFSARTILSKELTISASINLNVLAAICSRSKRRSASVSILVNGSATDQFIPVFGKVVQLPIPGDRGSTSLNSKGIATRNHQRCPSW
uniref:Uncharacterized protein n=1 Tax=Utricularia reniformis TaxID=192314 RepID=A0A1Y0B2W0_9LAMI|nr:hypothetical protein AEK19_MT1540 [Utricularia reniformis]ART31727.1 hypothetical protein AEK19_MT1540 [Utricularia reniformis]